MEPSEPILVRSDNRSPSEIGNHYKRKNYELKQSILYKEQINNIQPSHPTEFPKIEILKISFILVFIKQDFSKEVVLNSLLMTHFIIVPSHS